MKKQYRIDSKHVIEDLFSTRKFKVKTVKSNLCYPELQKKVKQNEIEREKYLSKLYGY